MSWYNEKSKDSDVVISTRIRLARNIKSTPFPSKLSAEAANDVLNRVIDALCRNDDFKAYKMQDLSSLDKQILFEEHLISPQLIQSDRPSGVVISKDKQISVMINEEDHIRIQYITAGFKPLEAWEITEKLDKLIEESLQYAFHDTFGYLTCCPTNVGTGMRISVMLHLPALTIGGGISDMLNATGKLGMTVRGLYGEGSEAKGNFYQISNQITLGQSEDDIIKRFENVINQIVAKERELQKALYSNNEMAIKDLVMRSYGILKNAYIMNTDEFMKNLSNVRLGVNLGIIGIDYTELSKLLVLSQPANIIKEAGESLSAQGRDIFRAQLLRNTL